jgi:hypothetical protein
LSPNVVAGENAAIPAQNGVEIRKDIVCGEAAFVTTIPTLMASQEHGNIHWRGVQKLQSTGCGNGFSKRKCRLHASDTGRFSRGFRRFCGRFLKENERRFGSSPEHFPRKKTVCVSDFRPNHA